MNPQLDWPTPDEEARLLTQLLSQTPTAWEEVASRYLPLLVRFLGRGSPRVAPELRDDAADRALIDFLCAPGRFDPALCGLGAYLRMAARRDLLNLLAKERRARRGIPLDSVAEPADCRNTLRDEDGPTLEHPRLAAERAAFDAVEQATYELMLEGARNTATFAARLGLAHLPDDEQAAAVKRVKDRVKKRLARAIQ